MEVFKYDLNKFISMDKRQFNNTVPHNNEKNEKNK